MYHIPFCYQGCSDDGSSVKLYMRKRIHQFKLAKDYYGLKIALNHCIGLQFNNDYHNLYFDASVYGLEWEFLWSSSRYLKHHPFKYADAACFARNEWDT